MGAIGKAGWVVAVVLVLVCAFLLMELSERRVAEAPEVASTGSGVDSQELAALDEVAQLRAELAEARRELDAAKAALADAEGVQEEAMVAAAEDTADDETVEDVAEAAKDDADDEADEDALSRGKRIANAQMTMMGEMMYTPLFDELGLAPDRRSYVKDVIGGHLTEVQQIIAGAMGTKDQTAKEVRARIDAAEAALREELAQTLSAEELEAWDAYEPVADQMLYERLVDGQLNMMAAGLTEDNRALASQVMAEELVREFEAFDASEQLYTLDNYNDAQARALQASLERLNGALPEDQYALVDGYVDRAIQMFDAMSERPAVP